MRPLSEPDILESNPNDRVFEEIEKEMKKEEENQNNVDENDSKFEKSSETILNYSLLRKSGKNLTREKSGVRRK